jgi:ketosteroid isomerase-like protein
MAKYFLYTFFLFVQTAVAQSSDETAIRTVLSTQQDAWNKGDINGFMQGYWKSDSLAFIGKSGVTYGWQKTLDNYKKGYPDTAAMGNLTFTLIKVEKIDKDHYFVIGKWFLKRSIGDIGGHFTLFFKRIKKQWVIVVDHSS